MPEASGLKETLLLKQPTISSNHVAFLYAGDIWIAERDGSYPRRLTAQNGRKTNPMFSPDGHWIAFSGNYDGNPSIYVIPKEGGSPRRLTFHPDEDQVRGWTQDGKSVLFSSTRESITARAKRLFTVPLEGGMPAVMPMDMAERGAFSPDGKHLAYTPYFEAFWSWKRYRGGMTVPIWVLDLETYDKSEIPHVNASDSFPCWVGNQVYFLSDRAHTMNVFRWQMGSSTVEQVTFHQDFDVRSLTTGAAMLTYEQAGKIHLIDTGSGEITHLSIAIASDLPSTRPHYKKAARYIQNYAISPTGLRAVFEARGDIFTVPVKKGEIRNLTHTPGIAERNPAWSPDGQSIAYFSDANGEYDLVISDQKGLKKTVIPLEKHTFFYSPTWSPDSKKIAFTDKALNLSYIELETRKIVHVDTDTYDHPDRSLNPAWSPDSQWLAYTRRLNNQIRAVFLYNLADVQTHQVTDGMSDTMDACFSLDGKYLFFTASSDYGLNTGWLDMSSYERPITRSLYVAVLNHEDFSPVAPESDDEKAPGEKPDSSTPSSDKTEETKPPAVEATASVEATVNGETGATAEEKKKPEPVKVKIDLDGLVQRIQALPVPARDYLDLQTAENKLFYMEFLPNQAFDSQSNDFQLNYYDFKERKSEVFLDKLQGYRVSADGKKVLCRAVGEPKYTILAIDKKADPVDGMLNLDGMDIAVDPKGEWKQIYREAFRIHRDYFYDAEMHGLDLEAAYQKYLPFLEHVGHRDDLNYLLAEFSGELVVSHAYVGAGDIPTPASVQIGLLGADYEVTDEGYYRIKTIFPGINWHPELRSPLTEPGVNVHEGDLILAVNGNPLRFPTVIYSRFEKTADHVTELLVGSTPDETEARTVSVRPIASEIPLRHWNWVEGNRKKVEELSHGRVAYVYMPDTSVNGYTNFNRYYFSQLDKEGVVLDERFNGGGSVADYVVDLLNRPILSYWATREGKPFATPNASILGPKVMITNELAGSGGDAMPLFFRRRGLGKLVGKRTWGGLIGIYDYPVLMDGGFITSPRMAIFSPQGQWEVENEGVAPDIEVEMTPKLTIQGHDPQLEKAVEVVLAELEMAAVYRPSRPAPVHRANTP
jgi:tricorn protease